MNNQTSSSLIFIIYVFFSLSLGLFSKIQAEDHLPFNDKFISEIKNNFMDNNGEPDKEKIKILATKFHDQKDGEFQHRANLFLSRYNWTRRGAEKKAGKSDRVDALRKIIARLDQMLAIDFSAAKGSQQYRASEYRAYMLAGEINQLRLSLTYRRYTSKLHYYAVPIKNLWTTWDITVGSNRSDIPKEANNLLISKAEYDENNNLIKAPQFYDEGALEEYFDNGGRIADLQPEGNGMFWENPGDISNIDIAKKYYYGNTPMSRGLLKKKMVTEIVAASQKEITLTFNRMKTSQTKIKMSTYFLDNKTKKKRKKAVAKGMSLADAVKKYRGTKVKFKAYNEDSTDPTASSLLATLGFNVDITIPVQNVTIKFPENPKDRRSTIDFALKRWKEYFENQEILVSGKLWETLDESTNTREKVDKCGCIRFKKGVIELYPKGLERTGHWNMGSQFPASMREARGLNLFNMWIANTDFSTDNVKTVIRTYDNNESKLFLLAHDIGHSMGAILDAAPNRFPTHFDLRWRDQPVQSSINWLKVLNPMQWFNRSKNLFKQSKVVELSYFNLWDNPAKKFTTSADLEWMAGLIGQLTPRQIEDAVKIGQWDTHYGKGYGKIFFLKLLSRRNDLVKLFGLNITHNLPLYDDDKYQVKNFNQLPPKQESNTKKAQNTSSTVAMNNSLDNESSSSNSSIVNNNNESQTVTSAPNQTGQSVVIVENDHVFIDGVLQDDKYMNRLFGPVYRKLKEVVQGGLQKGLCAFDGLEFDIGEFVHIAPLIWVCRRVIPNNNVTGLLGEMDLQAKNEKDQYIVVDSVHVGLRTGIRYVGGVEASIIRKFALVRYAEDKESAQKLDNRYLVNMGYWTVLKAIVQSIKNSDRFKPKEAWRLMKNGTIFNVEVADWKNILNENIREKAIAPDQPFALFVEDVHETGVRFVTDDIDYAAPIGADLAMTQVWSKRTKIDNLRVNEGLPMILYHDDASYRRTKFRTYFDFVLKFTFGHYTHIKGDFVGKDFIVENKEILSTPEGRDAFRRVAFENDFGPVFKIAHLKSNIKGEFDNSNHRVILGLPFLFTVQFNGRTCEETANEYGNVLQTKYIPISKVCKKRCNGFSALGDLFGETQCLNIDAFVNAENEETKQREEAIVIITYDINDINTSGGEFSKGYYHLLEKLMPGTDFMPKNYDPLLSIYPPNGDFTIPTDKMTNEPVGKVNTRARVVYYREAFNDLLAMGDETHKDYTFLRTRFETYLDENIQNEEFNVSNPLSQIPIRIAKKRVLHYLEKATTEYKKLLNSDKVKDRKAAQKTRIKHVVNALWWASRKEVLVGNYSPIVINALHKALNISKYCKDPSDPGMYAEAVITAGKSEEEWLDKGPIIAKSFCKPRKFDRARKMQLRFGFIEDLELDVQIVEDKF